VQFRFMPDVLELIIKLTFASAMFLNV